MKLLLATGNANKVAELGRALPGWEIEAFTAPGQPPENGGTFEANARIKARHAREHAPPDAWVAGEDSGIEAAALGGKPGVESARWAEDGVAALLAALEGEEDRRARYVCAIVALSPEGDEVLATGTLDGKVAAAPRGSEGFGYDPIMVPVDESCTVAELGDAWKAASSHRARAGRALAAALQARVAPSAELQTVAWPGAARREVGGSMVARVNVGEALNELTRLSAEIEQAAILDREGVVAATPGTDAELLRRIGTGLLEAAASTRPDATVERVEVATSRRAVLAVRAGERVAVATARQPLVAALAVHDLRTCLARLDEPVSPARKPRRKKDAVDA